MKKAFVWLDKAGVAYDFHDYKKAGASKGELEKWCKAVGWETVLNRAGTTFKKLPESDKDGLNERKAIALMMAQPSMIKRPMLDSRGSGKEQFLIDYGAHDVDRKPVAHQLLDLEMSLKTDSLERGDDPCNALAIAEG